MQPASTTIAIIGGGFSGTVLAANLLQRPPPGPTRVILVERRSRIGCGVAYSPGAFPYLLNVPAARMSATSDKPDQLIEYARRQQPEAGPESYLPRQLYGEYLQDLLQAAQRVAPEHVQFERIHGEATAVHPIRSTGALAVEIGDQRHLADQVVLACGDPPPTARAYAREVADHPAYGCNPHQGGQLQATDRSLLLIGTGLTMVDAAIAAAARNPTLQMIALSRHGLLPAPQQTPSRIVLEEQFDLCGLLASRSLRELVAAVRRLARMVLQRGGDWREAITRTRECVPELWQRLSELDRRRFLRHVRVYWDTHRHRMPPEFAERVSAMRRSGQLQVRAGCVRELSGMGERIAVRWRARGCSDLQAFSVDRVIDCSGSDHRLQRTGDVLWRYLLDAGLISPDPLGLGVRTGQDGALVDGGGRTSGRLFYLGPMLRADHWEATAVGELRARAEALAAALTKAAMPQRAAVAG